MKTSASILLLSLCFVTGVGGSLGWRMTMQRAVPRLTAASSDAEHKASTANDSKSADAAAKPAKEKEVFGRIECVDGLTKALAAADAKGIDEWSKRLAKTDVFLACEMLAASPKSPARDAALRPLIKMASAVDPFRAFTLFSKLGVSGVGDDTRTFLVAKMAEKDAKLAWDTLSQAKSLTNTDVEKIASVWGKSQGYAAATFGMTLQNTMQRSLFLRRSIAAWMAEDMGSFAKWFAQQPPGADVERFLEFGGFSDDERPKTPNFATLDVAVALNVGVSSSGMYQMFQAAWNDAAMREKAVDWIAAQKDPEVRDVAAKELAERWAEVDPARAREILPMIGDAKLRQQASSQLAAEMAKVTPQEAMQFATAIEDPNAREKSQASAMVTWARSQPAESLAYLRQHPEQLRPEYLSYAAREWVKVDPIGALEITDATIAENVRQGQLDDLAKKWYQRRPDQADAWLAKAAAGRIKEAVQKAKAGPAKGPRESTASWSGPNGEVLSENGGSGHSSTSATIDGRTMKYFY